MSAGYTIAVVISSCLVVVASRSAPAQTLPRDFDLPLPLFSSDSPWNASAARMPVASTSDRSILALYRVLRGDTLTLSPPDNGMDEPWPFAYVNCDDYSVPIFRMGMGKNSVRMRDYDGNAGGNNPKVPVSGGYASVPLPSGNIRPSGPRETGADGHIVLYDPATRLAYDFWQVTTAVDGGGNSLGGGREGSAFLAAGAIDYFDLAGTGVNPDGYSSARATGTPLLAGLIIPEDIESGTISHALALSIPGLRNMNLSDPFEPYPSDYTSPASTTETDFINTDPDSLAAGRRLRLKAALVDDEGNPLDESALSPITRMSLAALREYGAYIVDNAGGFIFYAEDIHTAVLNLSDAGVNGLIGRAAGTPLPTGKTRWRIVIEKLNEELESIPVAHGPWSGGQDPSKASITYANYEVIGTGTGSGGKPISLRCNKTSFGSSDAITIYADVRATSGFTPYIRFVTPDGDHVYLIRGGGLYGRREPYIEGPLSLATDVAGYQVASFSFSGVSPGLYHLQGALVGSSGIIGTMSIVTLSVGE